MPPIVYLIFNRSSEIDLLDERSELYQYAQYCEKEKCVDHKDCVLFNYDKNNPSIIFGEPKGRFGNHLFGYLVLHQLQEQIGIKSYITKGGYPS